MVRGGRGEKEYVTRADVIKLFPATACSLWQDALYYPSPENGSGGCTKPLCRWDISKRNRRCEPRR
jgi:hypothetical protein